MMTYIDDKESPNAVAFMLKYSSRKRENQCQAYIDPRPKWTQSVVKDSTLYRINQGIVRVPSYTRQAYFLQSEASNTISQRLGT